MAMDRVLLRWVCIGAIVPLLGLAQTQQVPSGSSYQGSYRPVPVQPQKGPPCGHYGTPACDSAPENVQLPPGASADQLFELGNRAFAQRQYNTSVRYMQRAAEMGHTRAQAAFGLDYVHGHGVPVDLKQAIFWLTKAADKGHRVAQGELGDLYEDGDGVPVDYAKAFRFHQLSANQGWWQGENRLGLDYEFGYGTPRNRALAIQWLRRAAADGNDGFSDTLASVLSQPTAPPHFRNIEEIGAFNARSSQRTVPGRPNCPANAYAESPGDRFLFCSEHPGCPFTSRVFGPSSCGGK